MKYENLTRGDYIRLGKAVADFNRKVNKFTTMENQMFMPDLINYKDVKDLHVTKQELDKYIKDLRSFNESNKEEVIYTSGETLTKWESDLLEQEKQIALRRLRGKLGKLPKNKKDEREQLQATIENLKNFEKLMDKDFQDTKKRIHRIGVRDYDFRRSLQYRQNYMKALESLSNYKNYDKFIKRLERIKNPKSFYNFIQRSEFFNELFVFYKEGTGIVIGNFKDNEEGFDYALEHDYNIKID